MYRDSTEDEEGDEAVTEVVTGAVSEAVAEEDTVPTGASRLSLPPKSRKSSARSSQEPTQERIRPGSVLTINLTHAPTTFSGVLISVRCRGPDTSFVLRNVVQRTGIEMQFFVNSPHVKEIIVVSRAGGSAADGKKKRKGPRMAKLFYLRDSPEKMTTISAGVR
jgi:ribosomal protein L19